MIMKNQVFIIFVILLSIFIENNEAGWKFWKKDKEESTTVTTTTLNSINVQSTITPINAGTTVRNVRPNQPNPGTEVGLDIVNSRPNRPEIENNENYREWLLDLTGTGERSKNQPPTRGSSQTQPSLLADSMSTSIKSSNMPIPTTPPSITGSKPGNAPQRPLVQSTDTGSISAAVSPNTRIDQNKPDTSSSPGIGKSWAEVVRSSVKPASTTTMKPVQSGYPTQSITLEEHGRTVTRKPIQPNRPQPSLGRDTSSSDGTFVNIGTTMNPSGKSYSSNPTYSRGNTVTDEDLEKLSEALYIKESNNANQYITINLQKQTTSSNPTDQAPQPLITINSEAFQIPTIQKVLSIFDNYHLDTQTNEHINPAQRQEESLLVDTFLSTNVMSTAMRFLANKGFVRQDYYEYKDTLRRVWFNLFSRGQGKIGSTGFEHVFMAETKQMDPVTEVLGLHNWIYFNAEETKGNINYLGYINKINLGNKGSIIKLHAKFNDYDKPVTSMFIGTSPELEMALYTVCFYTRPDGNCPVSLGGAKFNIVTHKFRYRGKDLIGTAYPQI